MLGRKEGKNVLPDRCLSSVLSLGSHTGYGADIVGIKEPSIITEVE